MSSVLEQVEAMQRDALPAVQQDEQPVLQQDEIQVMQQDAVQEKFRKALQKTAEETKDIKDLARDLTYIKGASDLQASAAFTEEYKAELGRQLLKGLADEGKKEAIKAAARKQEAQNLRCKMYYDSMRPIFKLLGIDEPFGLVAMIITTVLLMLPFLLVSLVEFTINSVNKLFAAIAKFTKPAYWLCTIVIVGTITIAIVIALLYGIEIFFGIDILRSML